MRVLLIGSTGVLGREAVPRLLAAGHKVTGLARNAERARVVRGLGIEPVIGDLFDAGSMVKALDGWEAVLNLATRIPTTAGAMVRGMKENDRVRADGSRVLVEAAMSAGIRVIVQEGISFVYADGGDAELTEDAPLDPTGSTRSSVEAHANIARFAEAGRTGVRLRIAALIGDDPMTHLVQKLAKLRAPVMYGDPAGWFTAIRPADAAAAAVTALAAPSGVYNVGANPVRKRDFANLVARVVGVRRGRMMPGWLLVGQFKTLGRSHRVVSTRLTETTGWRPEYSDVGTDWFARSDE